MTSSNVGEEISLLEHFFHFLKTTCLLTTSSKRGALRNFPFSMSTRNEVRTPLTLRPMDVKCDWRERGAVTSPTRNVRFLRKPKEPKVVIDTRLPPRSSDILWTTRRGIKMAIIRLRAPKPNMMPVTPYRTVLPDTKLTMKALYRRHTVDLSSSKDDFASSIPRDILTVDL